MRRSVLVPAAGPLVAARLGVGILLSVVFAFSGLGCAAAPANKAQADMATLRRETTIDKLVDRGKAFAMVGDMTRAEEYFTAALEQGANPHEVLPLVLDVCVRTGRYRSAAQHAENQLRKHPDDVSTRFVLGTLYVALGEPRQAREALEKVVEARPNEPKVRYALAVLARDSENDIVEADKQFREYLRLEPDGAHAEEARASLLKRVP